MHCFRGRFMIDRLGRNITYLRISVTDKLIHNVYKHGEQSYIQNVDKRDIFNWEDNVIHKKVNDKINKSQVLFNNSHVFISFAIRQKTLFQGFAVSHK